MPRGGKRTGTPGAIYGNRTDLQQGPRPGSALPVQTVPGQPYGAAKAQADAQRAVPLRAAGIPAAPAPAASAGPDLATLAAALPPMGAPTARPGEPLTAGLALGAGPGPEALTPRPAAQDPVLTGLSFLNALGDALPPELKAIRDVVGVGQAQQ